MHRYLALLGALLATPAMAQSVPDASTAPRVVIVAPVGAASDATIVAGGTAQTLFSGHTPQHGWAIYNPSASDTCWVSDSATAAENGKGSIPLAPGGGFETPYTPFGPVSVECPTTGDVLTVRGW